MSLTRALKLLVPVRRWIIRAILVTAFALLAWADATVAQTWYTQLRSADYPTVEGVVVAHRPAPEELKAPHSLVIEYTYEVNGTRFTSEQYWYGSLQMTTVVDDTTAARFPPGARVAVSYNPADPADAVLAPGFQGNDIILFWGLVALHCYALILAFADPIRGMDYSAKRQVVKPFGWRLTPGLGTLWPTFAWSLLMAIAVGVMVVPARFGLFLPVWESLGLTATVFAGACIVTRVWASAGEREYLDVDTAKRELRWYTGSTAAVAFEVVTDVRAIELELSPGKCLYWPQIVWLTPERTTRLVELPACRDRAAVEEVVIRIREAVFGTSAAPQLPLPVES